MTTPTQKINAAMEMTVRFMEFPMASRPQAAPACFSRERKPGSVGRCRSWNLITPQNQRWSN
jgi:hypothetical protein